MGDAHRVSFDRPEVDDRCWGPGSPWQVSCNSTDVDGLGLCGDCRRGIEVGKAAGSVALPGRRTDVCVWNDLPVVDPAVEVHAWYDPQEVHAWYEPQRNLWLVTDGSTTVAITDEALTRLARAFDEFARRLQVAVAAFARFAAALSEAGEASDVTEVDVS